MTQLADLQGIPTKQLVSAADKPAGFLIETDLFQNPAVRIHILNGKPIQNHHDVDIAVFAGFSTQMASLQTHVKQSIPEDRPAVQDQISQVFVQIEHRYFTP